MYDKNSSDHLGLLRKIKDNQRTSQRELAEELGFSLGKLNYILKSLKQKGFVKIRIFQQQKNKIKYMQYVITPKGVAERTKLTISFMKRKIKEYEELKKELDKE